VSVVTPVDSRLAPDAIGSPRRCWPNVRTELVRYALDHRLLEV